MAREIYVGHLPETVTEEELRKLFAVVGEVTSIHLIIDPETREFKRCGYVRMASGVNLNEVVETLDGVYLIDREIHVSIARPQIPGMSGKGKPWQGAGKRPGSPAGAGRSGAPRKAAAEAGHSPDAGKKSAAPAPGRRPAPAAGKPAGTRAPGGGKPDSGRTPRIGKPDSGRTQGRPDTRGGRSGQGGAGGGRRSR